MRLPISTLVFGAACYSPRLPAGAPCDDGHPCPSPQVCLQEVCEPPGASVEPPDAVSGARVDASIVVDACVPAGPDVCGDGIDQDCSGGDAICAVNDKPAGAIDVTAGGMFEGDLMLANDDLPNAGCNGDGGREVFYQVTLAGPRVYSFDTFGSGFDTSLRVFPGKACTQLAGASPTCNDDACNTGESMLATALPAGASCVVVDQNAGQTRSAFQLRVIAGERSGAALPTGAATLTGDTCTGSNVSDPTGCGDIQSGKDLAYYFTVCPDQTRRIDASTCVDPDSTHFDTVLYVRPNGGSDLACDDDAAASSCMPRAERPDKADGSILSGVLVRGPGLFWLVVDGFGSGRCGGYKLASNLR